MILFADHETFSEEPITHGTHAYAEHPSTEVLLTAWAIDDGEVQVEEGVPEAFVRLVQEADIIVYHNSAFDRTVLAAQQVHVPVEKVHDTMVQALAHGLPGGLEILGAVLKVPQDAAKMKAGKALIQLFCKPLPKNQRLRRATKTTHPAEWERFKEYAKFDIIAMREVYRRLPRWNYPNREHDLWCLDQTINERGFMVDRVMAEKALVLVSRCQRQLASLCAEQTDGEVQSTRQRDALLAHLLKEYGVDLPDLRAGTIERRLQDPDLPDAVKALLVNRQDAANTSSTKYKALLNAVSGDDRLRGGLQMYGASRTGRWGGRLFQPQNLPRPKMEYPDIEAAIEDLKDDVLDLMYPVAPAEGLSALDVLSSSLRSAIVAPPGYKLVVADLSNIEGRVLAWVAGEEWKLKAYRAYDQGTGPDLYLVAAGNILRKPPEAVTKSERQDYGKVPELACGYQGGVGAFHTMGQLYGLELTDAEALAIVKGWRAANPNIVKLWYALEDTAKRAIANPGRAFQCGKLIMKRSGAWFRIALPSGRELCYANPRIADGQIFYEGLNTYTRQWGQLTTYGGKLAENIVQATARDVLAGRMPAIEEAGYRIVLSVHDEILTEVPDTREYSAADLCRLMTTGLDWAEGLPLAAEGFEAKRYRK